MSLLISTDSFYPSRLGGPANTIYWMAKALVKSGVQVTVVTTDSYIEQGKVMVNVWSDLEGITVRYCSGAACLMKELRHTWKVMRGSNTVMLCDMFQRQVFPVAIMARLCGKRIIWSGRGELFEPALVGSRLKSLYLSIVKFCFGKYATFHATSEEETEVIYNHIGKLAKVVVIPNYIELPQQLKRETVSKPYFLFVGRVNRIKALDRLILGLSQSKLFLQSEFVLKIAGPNQENCQQELERIIEEKGLQDKVEFVGNVYGQEKNQLYANAYFSCLLSHSENFGNVVIEALSQGTPVIASTGTPWQVLNNTNAGYWIENRPETIASCVDKIFELSASQYSDMRKNALELANGYDVSKNISKWLKII